MPLSMVRSVGDRSRLRTNGGAGLDFEDDRAGVARAGDARILPLIVEVQLVPVAVPLAGTAVPAGSPEPVIVNTLVELWAFRNVLLSL